MTFETTDFTDYTDFVDSYRNKIMVNFRTDTCQSHAKHPFLSPLRGWLSFVSLPGASPLAIYFQPFGPVVEREVLHSA